MKKSPASTTRTRPRRKVSPPPSAPLSPASSVSGPLSPAVSPALPCNVGSLEAASSLVLGLLLLIAALFPRSLKQLLMLSLGAGLVYRGMTSHCSVYEAAGIDTAKAPLLPQLAEKLG